MTVPGIFFYVVLSFVAFVICDDSEEVDMSLFRFSTKTPYFFKPIGSNEYFNADLFTPRKVWAVYR